MLELLGLVGARVFGAAGGRHFGLIRSYGATPIESRATRIDVGVRRLIPEGVDVTLDNLGNQFVMQCIRATRRGGTVVGIGFAATGGRVFGFLRSLATLYVIGSLTGRKATFFGITQVHRRDPSWLREDLPELLRLAADGAIKPRIAARLPLLAARKAAEMIERGSGEGKIVHLAAIQPADATHVASQPDSPNSRA
jgi:NADPH:quinone reductase-like Zn-dependent oxidoreductase